MIDVSIVVPVYNVEKYLHRCVNSLLEQKLKNIEIILVDDGSTDHSSTICDSLTEIDHRITVLHKVNGGLSSARNAGLHIAKGRYVGFVDSDDDVVPEMFEKMFNAAEQNGWVDFVMSDYNRVLPNKKYECTEPIEAGYYNEEAIDKRLRYNMIMGSNIDYGSILAVWHCLYRREFLKTNDLEFDNAVRWSEDNLFSAMVLKCAHSFFYLKGEYLYNYYQNPGTITTSYKKGAWNIYKLMNKKLRAYFSGDSLHNEKQQLDFHMLYYAFVCIHQEKNQDSFKTSYENIKAILNDEELIKAFESISQLNISKKLKLIVYFMRFRFSLLLTIYIRGRNK